MKRLRVIVPCFHHEHVLPSAVKSIENQIYRDFKLNIVYDYPRMGKGFRLNRVVPHVEEAWLTVHDADDISISDRFHICSEYFDDFDVIYHDVYTLEGSGYYKKRIAGEWDRERYKRVPHICASSILVRTEIAQKVRWRTNTYGQDWIWLNLIAEHTDRIRYIPEGLLVYGTEHGFTQRLKLKSVRRFFLRRKIAGLTRAGD